MFTPAPVGLNSSMRSGLASARERISLMTTGAMAGVGSSAPGEPPATALARHAAPSSEFGSATASRGTSEKPCPSGASGHGARSL